MTRAWAPEPSSARDQLPTGFTPILDALVRDLPDAVCAAFVDAMGETVDVSARGDLYEARIAGAVAAIPVASLRERADVLGHGELYELRIEGDDRSVLALHSAHGYVLVLVLAAPVIDVEALERATVANHALAHEAGLDLPERTSRVPEAPRRSVSVPRMSFTFVDHDGRTRAIDSVLGYKRDRDKLFALVRLDDGEEVVVLNERSTGKWTRT